MLIFTRERGDEIVIGYGQQLWVTGPLGELVPVDPIRVEVLGVRAGGKVRLGFHADGRVSIHRAEVCPRIDAEIAARAAGTTPAA